MTKQEPSHDCYLASLLAPSSYLSLSLSEMRSSTSLDDNGEPDIMVIKRGQTTGLTVDRANELASFLGSCCQSSSLRGATIPTCYSFQQYDDYTYSLMWSSASTFWSTCGHSQVVDQFDTQVFPDDECGENHMYLRCRGCLRTMMESVRMLPR